MINKKLKRKVFGFLSGTLAPPLLKLLATSQSYQVENEGALEEVAAEGANFILAFWHGQMLPVLFYFTRSDYDQSRFYTFISPHRDGEYITRAAAGLGINALRTSLRDRRLSALRDAIEIARDGYNLAITPDGPIGPAFEAKQGIVRLSKKLDLPILPVAGLPSRGTYFESWDHFCLPHPFATVRMAYGEPVYPARDEGDAESMVGRLGESLRDLSGRVAGAASDPSEYRSFLDEAGS